MFIDVLNKMSLDNKIMRFSQTKDGNIISKQYHYFFQKMALNNPAQTDLEIKFCLFYIKVLV